MITDKKHIQQLTALLLKKGITDIVISPGSRNAPMINTFTGISEFNCRNIVDERSAAYFALGLALAKQNPVAIVCTSGTASLNYTPAVAEAFYQNISLIVITADRPDYWIDQAESQCIRQENIYRNFTKKGISGIKDIMTNDAFVGLSGTKENSLYLRAFLKEHKNIVVMLNHIIKPVGKVLKNQLLQC